ncbi:ATP-binding protein [Streptomyces sp. KLOTTS4A1]|uniref:ATP-binding protein n=1 Tax=Streptomyces sp. KLOTTS4A1 TaxID=3390996 RepID=UPI0039F61A5E
MTEDLAQLPCPTRHFGVQLSPTPRGARLARLLATERLRGWDLPPAAVERAAHVIAELATNAVTHARIPGRDFRLDLYVDTGPTETEALRIEVTDTRPERIPAPQLPESSAESGRGLLLVEAYADRWGVTGGPHPRKTVWARIDLAPATGLAPETGNPCAGDTGDQPQRTTGRKEPQPSPTPPSRHPVG